MESVKKNQKLIAIGAGVAAGTLGLYLLYKKRTFKKNTRFTAKEKDEMIRQIKVTYTGQFLSVETLISILEVLHKTTLSDLEAITSENRKMRLKNKDNFARYAEICEYYIIQNSQILVKAQLEVIDRLGISETLYRASYCHYFYQNHPALLKHGDEIDQLSRNDGSKSIKSIEEFRVLLKRLGELWETECMLLPTSKPLVKNLIYLPTVIQYRVNDTIFEEFGLVDHKIVEAISTYQMQLKGDDLKLFDIYARAKNKIDQVPSQMGINPR